MLPARTSSTSSHFRSRRLPQELFGEDGVDGVGMKTAQGEIEVGRDRTEVRDAGRDVGDEHDLAFQFVGPVLHLVFIVRSLIDVHQVVVGEAVPGADEIDQHIAAFVDGNDDVVDGAPRPPGIFQGDLPPGGDGNLFRSNAEVVANDPQRKTRVAASVVFHQERQAAEDPVGIRAEVEIAEAFGGRGQGNEGGEGVSAHVELVEIPAPLQRPFGAVEIGAHFVIAGVLPGRPTAGVLVEGEGETVGRPCRRRGWLRSGPDRPRD